MKGKSYLIHFDFIQNWFYILYKVITISFFVHLSNQQTWMFIEIECFSFHVFYFQFVKTTWIDDFHDNRHPLQLLYSFNWGESFTRQLRDIWCLLILHKRILSLLWNILYIQWLQLCQMKMAPLLNKHYWNKVILREKD